MYFCKLAPHKSDTQSSREKAVKNGVCAQTQVRTNARSQGKRGGTGQENEEQCIEKRQKGRFFFWLSTWISHSQSMHVLYISCSAAHRQSSSLCQKTNVRAMLGISNRWSKRGKLLYFTVIYYFIFLDTLRTRTVIPVLHNALNHSFVLFLRALFQWKFATRGVARIK